MNPLSWIRLAIVGALAAALVGFYGWRVHVERDVGRAEIRAQWDAAIVKQQAAALAESEANARESFRRIERQREIQLAQDRNLAQARADAARNDAAAGQLRAQLADTARRWRDALDHSPAGSECAAAGDAIGVLADVLGRADRRAGVLASYADTAREAGLQCQRDYDALIPPSSTTTERKSP